MKISTFDVSEEELKLLREKARANGHDPDKLSPSNLLRAALGFALRQVGGPRPNTGPKPGHNEGERQSEARS